ncbi:MAG: hypothetical protein NTV38_11280, partial [Chloroflexi bacterium]|nr:hypothetical protein [Chloroflexota bacterium]
MSPTTVLRDQNPRPQGRKQPDLHISGVAGALFGICLLASALGTILMTQNGVLSDSGAGVWTIAWSLLGTFFLFSLKIAAQWEKAVVLRLGK